MNDYTYLHGQKVSLITPALKALADRNHIPLSDLVAIKKAGNYTDFGISKAISKANALGLSVQSVAEIDKARMPDGGYRFHKPRFYHGHAA